MDWDFKSQAPQPVERALNSSLTHIFHTLLNLDTLRWMQKTSKAMTSHSKLLIQKFSKNTNYGIMHAAMTEQFGGRERSSKEWKQMARMARLNVTFEAYPAAARD